MRRSLLPLGLWATVGPAAVFLAAFFALPMFVFFLYSLWTKQGYTIAPVFTLHNYVVAVSNDLYRAVLLRTLGVGAATAAACVLCGFPVAYALAFRFDRARNIVLFILMSTSLASYLVRIYAWRTVLGGNGFFNFMANLLGLVSGTQHFLLYSQAGVLVTLVSLYLPLTVLPLYSALRNIPVALLESAADLGASPFTTFRRITLPLSASGLRSAFLFAFILGCGDYVTPRLVGGPSGTLIGVSITEQFGVVDNWPLGAALAFVVVAVYLLVFGALEAGLRSLRLVR